MKLCSLGLEFKWQDMWIGLFAKISYLAPIRLPRVDFWLCLIPCFPIHLLLVDKHLSCGADHKKFYLFEKYRKPTHRLEGTK